MFHGSMLAAVLFAASIWVEQPNGKLLMYDAAEFRQQTELKPPAECHQRHGTLRVYSNGLATCVYSAAESSAVRSVWISSSGSQNILTAGFQNRQPAPDGGALETTASPEVLLGSDGQRIFWFENRFTVLTREENTSRQPSSFVVWTTDLGGRDQQDILEIHLPRCSCDTGACEETCPQIDVWAPEGGIADFFFLTKWVPGQLQANFQETILYRLESGKWTPHKIAVIESLQDAAQHGDLIAETVPDGGCCGWDNESDDQTLVTRNGARVTIFDERERFDNPNYDVSFLTPVVRFSPDATRVAYTVAATAKPGQQIRLSDSGKNNQAELARLKRAIGDLPRVEVQSLAAPKKVLFSIPGELAGWLDDQRVLIFHDGALSVVDSTTGLSSPTPIKVRNAASVFAR